jgi:cobalt-zinc-cadmium efflux system membrane fusion protein
MHRFNNTVISKRETKRKLPPLVSWWCLSIFFLVLITGCTVHKEEQKPTSETGEQEALPTEVLLKPELMEKLSIRTASVSIIPPVEVLTVPGTIEPNPQRVQQITPLVAGRAEKIAVAVGDYVQAGSWIVSASSSQVAELHGKLHEAETRFKLAKDNYRRVQQGASRVAVLKAEATLKEAEASLKRLELLESKGIAAQKDVIAAQAEYERAKAEYAYQSNISLNREIAQAKSELQTAEVEVEHVRNALRALGARLETKNGHADAHDISLVDFYTPMSGQVIERSINPGAGFEAGKPLLTIADISKLWVIANVPELQIPRIKEDMIARVRSAALGSQSFHGRVTYIDPRLSEDTRTARVRVEVDNPKRLLKVGMFVDVLFDLQPEITSGRVYIPDSALQRSGESTFVFVANRVQPGKFLVRNVQAGQDISGTVEVTSGLRPNEQVVIEGGLKLKALLLKSQFAEQD